MKADDWVQSALEAPLRELIALIRAARDGGVSPSLMRERLNESILSITSDTDAHTAGLTPDLTRQIRHALFALADELASRPGSQCNYPAQHDLLQQEHMHTDNAGALFFNELSALLDDARGDPAKTAVASVYALCLSLGFRGIYAGYELEGYEELRARVMSYVRPTLISESEPPDSTRPPWPRVAGNPRPWSALAMVAVSTVVLAALLTLHIEIKSAATSVAEHINSSAGMD